MPYIETDRREKFRDLAVELGMEAVTVGELNYAISKILHTYLEHEQKTYAQYNAVIGVLECAKLELYRQLAAPYEDEKKDLNGPVSSLDTYRGEVFPEVFPHLPATI
jgi:hypothetical protein